MKEHIENEQETKSLRCDETMAESSEEDTDKIRSNTPISMVQEEEDKEIQSLTWQFEKIQTTVECVGKYLFKNYGHKSFNDRLYKNLRVPKYISDKVNKLQFFIMGNQWGFNKDLAWKEGGNDLTKFKMICIDEICSIESSQCWNRILNKIADADSIEEVKKYWGTDDPKAFNDHRVRMRISCYFDDDGIKHSICMGKRAKKCLLTVESTQTDTVVELMRDHPEYFFCAECNYFMFESIFYANDNQFAIPDESVWPECPFLQQSVELDDTSYVSVYSSYGICSPDLQKPSKKKQKVNE